MTVGQTPLSSVRPITFASGCLSDVLVCNPPQVNTMTPSFTVCLCTMQVICSACYNHGGFHCGKVTDENIKNLIFGRTVTSFLTPWFIPVDEFPDEGQVAEAVLPSGTTGMDIMPPRVIINSLLVLYPHLLLM